MSAPEPGRTYAQVVRHESSTTCRLCDSKATQRTRYVVLRENEEYASVVHATCARHTVRLMHDMIEAGWVVAERDGIR